jgi:flagellar motor switch protein FliN/FliY
MSGSPDQSLMQIGESTADAVMGVLQIFCPEPGQITKGLVAAVPNGTHPMEGIPVPSVATGVSFVDGVTGGNVFVMPMKGARRLAAAMMGEALPEDDDGELSELDESAVAEAMNQMMSAAAMAASKVLGKEVEISIPEIKRFDDAKDAVAAYDTTPYAVTAQFSILGQPCRLCLFVPNAFIVRMNRALSEMTTEYTSDYTDGPLSTLVRDVPLRLWAELGRVRMPLARLVGLPPSAVVGVAHEVDEPIDLYVDDMCFAQGRLVVTDDSEWAVRIEKVHGLPDNASHSPSTTPQSLTAGPTTQGD